MYLIDTNVIILAIAGREIEASFLRRAIMSNAVLISVITVLEFLTKANKDEVKAFEALVSHFPALDIDAETARLAAVYRKNSFKKSRISMLDCLLAAQAKRHNAVLVTNNVSDFPKKTVRVQLPS